MEFAFVILLPGWFFYTFVHLPACIFAFLSFSHGGVCIFVHLSVWIFVFLSFSQGGFLHFCSYPKWLFVLLPEWFEGLARRWGEQTLVNLQIFKSSNPSRYYPPRSGYYPGGGVNEGAGHVFETCTLFVVMLHMFEHYVGQNVGGG